MAFKTCSGCGREKPFSSFYARSRFRKYPPSPAGVSNQCKDCDKSDRRQYNALNPKAKKQADRKQHLKRYGLTPESYDALLQKQGGCCLGCSTHHTEFNRNLVVDHCHDTGKVRGLLCVSCNLILGYALDEPTTLLSLVKYLGCSTIPESAVPNSDVTQLTLVKKVG